MNQKSLIIACYSLIIFSFLWSRGFAQEGIPYMSNFNLPIGFNNQNWEMVQDDQGTLLFANRRGLTSFDGIRWKQIEIAIIPYSMKKDTITGRIYIGSDNVYGYLEKNGINDYMFIRSSEPDYDYGIITNIDITAEAIYFYSNRNVTRINRDGAQNPEHFHAQNDTFFGGYIVHGNTLYVNIPGQGLFEMSKSGLYPIPGGNVFDNVSINFFIHLSDSIVLIGTDNSFLYFFDGQTFKDFLLEDEEYLFGAVISGGLLLEDQDLALATLTGGCVIINMADGKIKHRINYQAGLPDDEIYAMTTDFSNGLWLTHESGASRVDLTLPIENYNAFSGLEGNLSEVIMFDGTLYVSTSEGVYFLEPKMKYKETEVLVRQTPRQEAIQSRLKDHSIDTTPEVELAMPRPGSDTITRKSGFRRFVDRIFNRTGPDTSRTRKVSGIKKETVLESPRTEIQQPRYVRKKIVRLQSKTYEFTKVNGLNSKCRQLFSWNGHLLAATNTGLFEIQRSTSTFIITDAYIHSLHPVPGQSEILLVGTNSGMMLVKDNIEGFMVNERYIPMDRPVYSMLVDDQTLWLGSDSRVMEFSLKQWDTPVYENAYELYTPYLEKVQVKKYLNQPTFFIPSGIFQISEQDSALVMIQPVSTKSQGFLKYIFTPDGSILIQDNQEWMILNATDSVLQQQIRFLNLYDDIKFLNLDSENNLWIIDGHNGISKLKTMDQVITDNRFEVFFNRISNHLGERFTIEDLSLNPHQLPLEFSISAPFYLRADRTEFQYFLKGLEQPWSSWSTNQIIYIPYMPSGDYVLTVRARNVFGKESEIKSIQFYIKPPFTSTWPFYTVVGISLILLILLIVLLRERKLIRDKKILELKVQDRTQEIARQNEEISRQKEEITDSINYGERIQKATLPPKELLDTIMPEYFILFKPRDIVSGDFYWIREKNGKLLIAVVDCTGHGVPGAFMSFLGYSLLSEIGNKYQVTTASSVLNRLRTNLKHTFHQTDTSEEAGDGMDMGLAILDPQKLFLQYAGAYNPLYVIRGGKLLEFYGDKMPIGAHLREEKPFSNHRIQLKEGDSIYMFTDGFTDQFGGQSDKKFKIIPFQDLLLRIQDKSMTDQKNILDEELRKWMGNQDQVDDILVMGFRV